MTTMSLRSNIVGIVELSHCATGMEIVRKLDTQFDTLSINIVAAAIAELVLEGELIEGTLRVGSITVRTMYFPANASEIEWTTKEMTETKTTKLR